MSSDLGGAELFVSVGPNPWLVRMFAAEKSLFLRETFVDLIGAENRKGPYLAINPGGQMPALRLASGQVIAETLAICEYIEELLPDPPLLGATPEDRAEARMWLRRVENLFVRPMIDAYRYGVGYERFKGRMRLIPDAADDLVRLAQDGAGWLNAQTGEGPYLTGQRVTLADIMLYIFQDFAETRGVMARDPEHAALGMHFNTIAARPAAVATRHFAYNGPA